MHVYRRSAFLFVAVLLSVCMAGCVMNVSKNESETRMGSHDVTVKPGRSVTTSTQVTSGESNTYESEEFTCGNVVVRIENEALSVNGKPYGTLHPHDSVVIDHGTVLVNGKPRSVTPAKGPKVEEEKNDSKPSAG